MSNENLHGAFLISITLYFLTFKMGLY